MSTTRHQLHIDLGLAHWGRFPAEVETHLWSSEAFFCCLRVEHRLAKRRRIDLSQLSGDPFILFPRAVSPHYHDQIIATCVDAGFSPKIWHEARLWQTVVTIVEFGMGVALVPQALAKTHSQRAVFRSLTRNPFASQILRFDARGESFGCDQKLRRVSSEVLDAVIAQGGRHVPPLHRRGVHAQCGRAGFGRIDGRLLWTGRYRRRTLALCRMPRPWKSHRDSRSGRTRPERCLESRQSASAGTRTMVLPGVAAFTRVCAYDRPGTLREVNPQLEPNGPPFVPSRSTPVHQPRTTRDKVADLHALLKAAKIPGPYVLVGHSAGGLVSRLYASTYPDDVVGMVLVDSTPENVWLRFHEVLPPDQWKTFEALTVKNQELLDAYPESEQWWTAPLADDASTRQVREARARTRMRPIPLFVLVHGKPFPAPFPGWPTDKMEKIMSDLHTDLSKMTPDGKIVIAKKSEHDIHQDQPELVIAAIRQVVDAVRDPKTWKAASMPSQ